jgi:hypothetical protein
MCEDIEDMARKMYREWHAPRKKDREKEKSGDSIVCSFQVVVM